MYLTSSRGGATAAAVGLGVLLALGPARTRLAGAAALGAGGGAALVGLTELRSPLVDSPAAPAARAAGDEILLATLIVCAGVGMARYVADRPLARLTIPRVATRIGLVVLAFMAMAAVAAANPVARFDEFRDKPPETQLQAADVAGQVGGASGSGRYQFWSAAVDAFADDPITGIGAGGYEAWWNENGPIPGILRDAHSLFFETAAELGIAGLALIVSFLALGAVHGWRRRAGGSRAGAVEATLALLVTGVLTASFEWTWELPAAFGPVVVAVALLTGPATLRRASDRPAASSHGGADGSGAPVAHRSFGWGVATLLTGWVAVWIAAVLLLTETRLDDSRAAADRGDVAAAAQNASDASTLQPWAAEPRLQLALVEEGEGNYSAAREEIGEAIDRAPDDWSLWYVASRIEEAAGDRDAARSAYEVARSLNPRAIPEEPW
jgi:O-Antigen ligase